MRTQSVQSTNYNPAFKMKYTYNVGWDVQAAIKEGIKKSKPKVVKGNVLLGKYWDGNYYLEFKNFLGWVKKSVQLNDSNQIKMDYKTLEAFYLRAKSPSVKNGDKIRFAD